MVEFEFQVHLFQAQREELIGERYNWSVFTLSSRLQTNYSMCCLCARVVCVSHASFLSFHKVSNIWYICAPERVTLCPRLTMLLHSFSCCFGSLAHLAEVIYLCAFHSLCVCFLGDKCKGMLVKLLALAIMFYCFLRFSVLLCRTLK